VSHDHERGPSGLAPRPGQPDRRDALVGWRYLERSDSAGQPTGHQPVRLPRGAVRPCRAVRVYRPCRHDGQRGRGYGVGAGVGFRQRNTLSLTAIGVVALYVLLALTTRFVLLGIFPVLMSIRATRRREPLAPLAIAAAVIAVLVAILALR
jgi:hypothetical protein